MSESLLKKEFNTRDVQRIRNIVNKDFESGTRTGIGYDKNQSRHKEGDIWEEDGRKWTIKNGIRQNITKLDSAKKAIQIPLRCPKCGGPMKHRLAKKMYKIHGFCFDPCTVEYEATLRKAGLYKQYEKQMIQGNLQGFADDIEAWVMETINASDTFVTEQGDVEDWTSLSDEYKHKVVTDLREYVTLLRSHID